MAGIIYGMIQWPDDSQAALEFATAASRLKHLDSGRYQSGHCRDKSLNERPAVVEWR
jgi:hypothetical protein